MKRTFSFLICILAIVNLAKTQFLPNAFPSQLFAQQQQFRSPLLSQALPQQQSFANFVQRPQQQSQVLVPQQQNAQLLQQNPQFLQQQPQVQQGVPVVQSQAFVAQPLVQQSLQVQQQIPLTQTVASVVPSVVPRFCPFKEDIKCDTNFPYRTFDGSCNNLENLWWGRSETPYKRLIDPSYGDGVNSPRLSQDGSELPNARDLVCSLHSESHEIEPFISHMFMQWGQLVNHDITSLSITTDDEANFSICNSCMRTEKCFPITITPNVSNCLPQMRHECVEFTRSSSTFKDTSCSSDIREQLNLQTSFLDGSIIYGTSLKQNEKLRDRKSGRGRLRMQTSRRLLPMDTTENPSDCLDFTKEKRCFISGDDRVNQNPGLMTIQTVFLREHNRIADILATLNPSWEDETVFQETRRLIIAMIQHITYNEYLPILLGETIVQQMNLLPGQGTSQVSIYTPSVDPRIANEYASAAGRFGHSMIRSIFTRANKNYESIGSFMLRNSYFRANMLYDENGMESIARGFLKDPLMKVDRWFSHDVSKHLFETLDDFGRPFHFDLISINIQRGRDHGIPGYVKFRQFCRLTPIRTWSDMKSFIPAEVVDIFSRHYKFVDDVDLFSAAVSEFKQDGAIIGPTLTCLIGNQFRDLKLGDRFWYETASSPASFTPNQLAEIRKMSLSKLLCRNLNDTPKVQPKAMFSSKLKGNGLIDCSELTDINWNQWKI